MKKLILISFLLLFISTACVSAADDINQAENMTLDNDEDILISADFNQLQNLINDAGSGDTISLTTDYVGSSEITINKDLTINGNGHSIDASHSSRIFNIHANKVVLNNIKFVNGNSGDFGGAIYTNNSIKIDNCQFIDNYARYRGGAIFAILGNIDISNSVFSKNSAENGGAIGFESTKTNFYNVTFIENSASWGGGVLTSLYEIDTTVAGCRFINNVANQYGASICANNQLNVINSNFESNNPMEFVYYFDDWDGRNGSFYLKNNKMASSYLWKIYYRGDTPIASPVYLKFVNKTVNSGDRIPIGNVYDDNGNTIELNSINLKVYDKYNKLVDEYKSVADHNSGYLYSVNLSNGIYRLTGSLSGDYASDCTVIDGILNVGDVDDKFVPEIVTAYKKSGGDVVLTSSISPATATGSVVFNVNNKNYTASVKDGKASIILSNLENGTYTVKTFYGGDDLFEAATAKSISFIVGPSDFILSASNLTKYYKGPERFIVSLTDKQASPLTGQVINITINGLTYSRITDDEGKVSMAINLNSGVYKAFVSYEDGEITSTVTIKSTISGSDITKIYRNATQYYAAFVDSNGNPVKNTDVEFNIYGVFYNRQTNDEGIARMNINLNPGTYIITAKNPLSGELYTNKITVLPNMDSNKDLTKYYKNDSQYTIRLLGSDGKAVGANVSVVFNINGVFYTRMTNESGYAKLNINLGPGDYIITADYNGLKASNKIKVLSVLETKDLKMHYLDGSKFEAKVLDGHGKPFANQNVIFNINGVFYKKMSNENGIASLNINLMPGQYIITSSYNDLNVANKITIS